MLFLVQGRGKILFLAHEDVDTTSATKIPRYHLFTDLLILDTLNVGCHLHILLVNKGST